MLLNIPSNASCIATLGDVCVDYIEDNLYGFTINGQDPEDHIFWITPDGSWAQGHYIEKYLEPDHTYNFGKVYVAEKNDIDFAIDSYEIPSFTTNSATSYIYTNPTIGTNPLQISSSWSAAFGYQVFTILTITNTSGTTAHGTVNLSYENDVGYDFSQADMIIPTDINNNDWADFNFMSTNPPGSTKTDLNWSFPNLQAGEQRHIYVPFNVAHIGIAGSSCQLIGTGGISVKREWNPISDDLKFETRTFPHDPNFIVLEIPDGPQHVSHNYCYTESEVLEYLVGFQNEGEGKAKDVHIILDIDEQYYEPTTLAYLESGHPDYTCSYEILDNYNDLEDNGVIKIEFNNINLLGLANPTSPYHKTLGFISFEIQTICNAGQSLAMDADITFFGEDETAVAVVPTNTVTAVVIHNVSPDYCAPCLIHIESEDDIDTSDESGSNGSGTSGGSDKQALDTAEGTVLLSTITPNPCSNHFVINYEVYNAEQAVGITLFDITGKKQKELWQGNKSEGHHRLISDMTGIENGIYIVMIQVGNQRESHKLVKW